MRTIGRILSHESDSPRNVITCAYFLLCYSLPFCVWFVPPFVPYFDCDGRTAPRKCIRPMSPMQSEVGRRVADTAQRGLLDVKGLLMCVFIIVLYDSDIDHANGTHCAVCTCQRNKLIINLQF